MRFDSGLIDDDMRPYFRDVHDHTLRIDERIDSLREMLSSALDANLLMASVQQNEVMKLRSDASCANSDRRHLRNEL